MNKQNNLKRAITDIKNKTSKSVDFLLSDSVSETLSKKGIWLRKPLAPLMRKAYINQSEFKLIIDKKEPLPKTRVGKIFMVNHTCADDIVLGVNVVKKSGYILFGNKYLSLDTINGLGLWAYGQILLDRDDELNRESSVEKMKFVLYNGVNVIVYPEGYWNLADNGQKDERNLADDHNSESWLIQDFNIGSFKLAQATGALIVPTVLHYDAVGKKMCFGSRLNPIGIEKTDNVFAKKDEVVQIFIDEKYRLMEKYSNHQREILESEKTLKEQWEELKEYFIRSCDIESIGYKLDLADEKRIGKAKVVKGVITNEEAFAHLESIDYNNDNAWLLKKTYTGRRQ
ncbi:MAG: hypothetical protein GX864_02840 [Mollicutes bacterium]|nr:hypothetical protein [Mollicutes bacterium]